MPITQTIPQIINIPNRVTDSPEEFSENAVLGLTQQASMATAQNTYATQANALAVEVNSGASNAASSEANAASSASAASTSESIATTKASEASASAANALTSEQAAELAKTEIVGLLDLQNILGNYQSGQPYEIFDVVRDVADGSWYIVIVESYTSVSIADDVAANNLKIYQTNVDNIDALLGAKYAAL